MGRSPCHSLLPNRTETLAAQARAVWARIATHAQCVRPLFGFNGASAREDTGGEAGLVPRSRVSPHHTNQFDKKRSVFKTMRFSKGPLSSASVFISVFGHANVTDRRKRIKKYAFSSKTRKCDRGLACEYSRLSCAPATTCETLRVLHAVAGENERRLYSLARSGQ